MINTAPNHLKAYLKTKGTLEYRGCAIYYYTYSMFDEPNKFKIIVNVELHYTQNNFIKTLALDEQFDKEDAAINYGIKQGKKMIDKSYELGKINIVKINPGLKAKNEKVEKPKDDKGKSSKK